jgi:hypothetical protein
VVQLHFWAEPHTCVGGPVRRCSGHRRVRTLAARSELMCLSQFAQGDSGKRLKYHLLGGGGGGAASNAAQPPANGPPVRLTHISHSSRAHHPGFRALDIAPLLHMKVPVAARRCVRCMAPCAVSCTSEVETPADGAFVLGAHTSLPGPRRNLQLGNCVTMQPAAVANMTNVRSKGPLLSPTGAGGQQQQRQRQPGAGREWRRGFAAGAPAGPEAHRRPPRVQGPGGQLLCFSRKGARRAQKRAGRMAAIVASWAACAARFPSLSRSA